MYRVSIEAGLAGLVEPAGTVAGSDPQMAAELDPPILEIIQRLVTEVILVIVINVTIANVVKVKRPREVHRGWCKAP